jgi:hypothetical protein
MENFADFIIDYIESNYIHGITGWLNQLHAYQWEANSRIEKYPDAIETTRKFNAESRAILKTPNNDEKWFHLCDEIRKWGGMKKIPSELACSYQSSIITLSKCNPDIHSDFSNLAIRGDRIATASKIYYYADPWRWTIYDSRVGYALHQLLFEYGKRLRIAPTLLFPDISLCLPDSQTDRRNPVFKVSRCYFSETKSRGSFIWTSHLHRIIARMINESSIQRPSHSLSSTPQWEIPHIEMVFFVIGNRKWVADSDISVETNSEIPTRKRGDIVGKCPWCGHPVKIRQSRKTGEFYEGCTNFPVCPYKGNRSH